MSSFQANTSTNLSSRRSPEGALRSTPLSPSPLWITSAATVPFLAVLVADRLLGEGLIQVGLACEEVFRGTRLPLLKAPWRVDETPSTSVHL
ncbi:MAG: hypothetical protein AAFZ80_02515 [Cyanobacteria bacterium P01_A01_bin.105]